MYRAAVGGLVTADLTATMVQVRAPETLASNGANASPAYAQTLKTTCSRAAAEQPAGDAYNDVKRLSSRTRSHGTTHSTRPPPCFAQVDVIVSPTANIDAGFVSSVRAMLAAMTAAPPVPALPLQLVLRGGYCLTYDTQVQHPRARRCTRTCFVTPACIG